MELILRRIQLVNSASGRVADCLFRRHFALAWDLHSPRSWTVVLLSLLDECRLDRLKYAPSRVLLTDRTQLAVEATMFPAHAGCKATTALSISSSFSVAWNHFATRGELNTKLIVHCCCRSWKRVIRMGRARTTMKRRLKVRQSSSIELLAAYAEHHAKTLAYEELTYA